MGITGGSAPNAITAVHPSKAPAHRHTGDTLFLSGLQPGQHLRATAQTNLRNGEFVVLLNALDGQPVHMKLPPGVREGDILSLVFVSREPRPAFVLLTDAPLSPAPSSLLSQTGRFINDLLQRSNGALHPATLQNAGPLLATPPAHAAQVAQLALGLARTIGRSGLFYESHQAQWVKGNRSLAELLVEPQARLPGSQSGTSGVRPATASALPAPSQAAMRESLYPNPVHPEALSLVRQQLEVFETRHICWQGEAWPGQVFVWDAAEEAPEESGEQGELPGIVWHTRLLLTLPNLGPVTASLRLDARGVEVRLAVVEPSTAAMLQKGAAPLAEGLESAGIRLLRMGMDVDEETRSP